MSARLDSLDLQGQAHVNNDDGHRTSATATEDVRDVGQLIFLVRALLLPNPKAARHAVALHNSQRPHAHFLSLSQDVYRPLRSRLTSGGIVIRGLLSTQQTTKCRRVDVVKPTVRNPDAGIYQEQR